MNTLAAISLAKQLAQAAGFDDWLAEKLGDKLGGKAAGKIIDLANKVTGEKSGNDALSKVSSDLSLQAEFRGQLIQQEADLLRAQLNDVQDARDHFAGKSEMAEGIANRVIAQNHLAVLLLLIGNGAVLYFVDDKTIAVALGNIIGTSIGALWQERQQVINFFFGSSLGSKLKDAISGRNT